MPVDPDEVMSTGDRLLAQHPEAFSTDFHENRQRVQSFTNLGSKHLCNRIAGYITRQRQRSDGGASD